MYYLKNCCQKTQSQFPQGEICVILELYYSFLLGVMVLGYKDGTDQNENSQLNRFGGIWKISLKIFFVSIIDVHLEGRVGSLSD